MIRSATPEDLGAIAAIQAGSSGASHWAPESYLGYDCLVAEVQGSVVGFLVTRRTAPDEGDILNLAVDPAHRRRGIGRRLLAHALVAGGAWFLEVRQSNRAAISLYQSLGFEVAGQRPEYYHNPTESGIVLRLRS